jgi:DNA-binding protein HU-beta
MNKPEILESMANKTGESKKLAEVMLAALLDTVSEELAKGESVQLVGFGTFSVGKRSAREGKNPRTGEPITIAATKTPKFKAGKNLKNAVNE